MIGSWLENIRFYSPFSINNLGKKSKPQKQNFQLLSDLRASETETQINYLNNLSFKHISPRNTQTIEAKGALG